MTLTVDQMHISTDSRRIGLIVDNPRRDLSGLVLVGRELALRGHTVYLVPMNLRLREVSSLAPDQLLVNYLRPTNDASVGELMDAGVGVSILDTEGAVFQEVEAMVVKMSHRVDVSSRIDTYCAWGSFMAQFLQEHGFFQAGQVEVTGPPRMDFYVDPWRRAAETCSSAAVVDEQMVLICGSFPFANPEFRDPEELIAMRVTNTGLSESHVRAEYEKDRAGMEGFIAMSRALADRLPQTTFVYRPHPFERSSTYGDHFGEIANLRVIDEGPVDGWILRAAAVVQPSDCTTGVEAAFAGVPAFVPGWVRGDRVPVVEAVSRVCADLDELADAVCDAIKGVVAGPDGADALVESLFGPQDGKAHQRVVDAIERAVPQGELDVAALRRLHYQRPEGTPLVSRAMSRAKEAIGLPAMWSIRTRREIEPVKWDRSQKAFDADRVNGLLQAIDAADPGGPPVRATVAGSDDYRYRFGVGRSVRIAVVR